MTQGNVTEQDALLKGHILSLGIVDGSAVVALQEDVSKEKKKCYLTVSSISFTHKFPVFLFGLTVFHLPFPSKGTTCLYIPFVVLN